MKVLVTGHLGYIGCVLTEQLTQKGHAVTGMDCESNNSLDAIPMLDGDIRDIAPDALRGFEAVIHLAALPADLEDQRFPETSLEVNHLAASRLAVLAKVAGAKRFIFASASPEQHGGTSGYQATEPTSRTPVPFDIAKGRAELDLARLNSYDFRVITLRIPSAYGRSPKMRSDLVINALVEEALESGELGFNSNSNDLHRPIHISDVARGFSQALDQPAEELTKPIYDLGANVSPIEHGELIRLVVERTDGARLHHIPSIPYTRAGQPRHAGQDPGSLPGFQTEVNLTEGIEQLVKEYL